MKMLLSLALLVPAANALAATATLRIPLFVEVSTSPSTQKLTPMSEVNKTLAQKGLSAQPEAFEVAADGTGLPDRDAINAVLAKAGLNAEVTTELYPGENNTGKLITCYKGDASAVVDVVAGLVDRYYSDQYTLNAWKVGAKTWTSDGLQGDTTYLAQSKYWAKYNTKSSSVLLIASVGDDGTDVSESLIPACK